MQRFTCLLLVLFSMVCNSQLLAQTVSDTLKNDEKIYAEVEKKPEYPRGLNAFRSDLTRAFNTKAIRKPGVYSTTLKFIVDTDGSLIVLDAEGESPEMNKQAEKALKSLKRKWSPAIVNGKPVRYRFKLPLKMNL